MKGDNFRILCRNKVKFVLSQIVLAITVLQGQGHSDVDKTHFFWKSISSTGTNSHTFSVLLGYKLQGSHLTVYVPFTL